jgi:integrase
MATLIKLLGSPYYIAAFDVPQNGTVRRLKKFTKKTKRSEAMTEAIRMEELERAAGVADRTIGRNTRTARREDLQGMILVGFYAGARLGDCARLIWGNVNLTRKTLSFMPAKTDRKRKRLQVPLHPRLVTGLQGRTIGKDDEPLFPVLFKTSVSGNAGLSS